MSETAEKLTDLKDLGAATSASEEQDVPREPKIDELGRTYATGRRKDAVARVWLTRGKGKITVNGKDQSTYFARLTQRLIVNEPFLKTDRAGQYDINCTVKGGGLSGQAGAVRHGISRALDLVEPELHKALKAEGMLTRDSRRVERKKPGRRKARRGQQWAKR